RAAVLLERLVPGVSAARLVAALVPRGAGRRALAARTRRLAGGRVVGDHFRGGARHARSARPRARARRVGRAAEDDDPRANDRAGDPDRGRDVLLPRSALADQYL